jgi:signal peptide peptidase SppA
VLPDLLASLDLPRFGRVTDYVGAWAIEPRAGQALLDLVGRTDLGRHVAESVAPTRSAAAGASLAKSGQQTIGVVMLTGTLQKATSSMSAGTSTVEARRELRKAAADPDIDAILLAIDSPGGTVAGTADLAADVRAANAKKPVWAFVDDLGASAAYWVASQADRIFANDKTALVGSIGTLSVVYDLSAAAEKEGIKTLVFGTGPLKGTGAPGAPVTEDQQAYIRGIVEDAQLSFDAAVRKGRGLTDKQLADVKSGGVFGATEALSLKLIDGIQSFDATVAGLAAEARKRDRMTSTRAAGPGPQRSAAMTETETLPAAGAPAKPATYSADVDAQIAAVLRAQREALAAEAERVAAVQQHCTKHPDIAAKAIREGWTSEKAELAAMRADLAVSPVRTGGPNFVFGKEKLAAGVGLDAVLEAGLSRSMGVRDVEKRYKPEVLEAADAHYRGLGLQQVIMLAAAANGYAAGPGERITTATSARSSDTPSRSGSGRRPPPSACPASSATSPTRNSWPGTWRRTRPGGRSRREVRLELPAGHVVPDARQHGVRGGRPGREDQARVGQRGELHPAGEDLRQDVRPHPAGHHQRRPRGVPRPPQPPRPRAREEVQQRVLDRKFLSDHATFWTAARTNYISGATTNLGLDGVGLGLGVKAFRR